MPTVSPTAGTVMVITPHMGGGHNSETYWVGGSNVFPLTRAKCIYPLRPNYFRRSDIIAKNCMEGLMGEKNISLDKSKSMTTLASCMALIWFYNE